MATNKALQLNLNELDGLVDRLSEIAPDRIGAFLVDTVNDVGSQTYALSRIDMQRNINIRDSYIDRKLKLKKATSGDPKLVITGEADEANISHYGGIQKFKLVNWTNAKITAMGHSFGKWPGWTYRKGNKALGIDEDTKADGKSFSVRRGSRKELPKTFSIPGKTDLDGNLLAFRRNDDGKVQSVLGPAVYQLFRRSIDNLEDDIYDRLEKAVVDGTERLILSKL